MVSAQAPLEVEKPDYFEAQDRILVDWKLDSANQALQTGLPGLALSLYADLLSGEGLTVSERADLSIRSAVALIAQANFKEAEVILSQIPEPEKDARFYLYLAITLLGDVQRSSIGEARNLLNRVAIKDLSREDAPWYFYSRGLVAEFSDAANDARALYKKALEASATQAQRYFFESILWRQSILQSPGDEDLVDELANQLRRLSGQSAAFLYVKEYAILLHKLNRTEGAVNAINTELSSNTILSARQREQLLLLKGLIQGLEGEGREVLRELIRKGKSSESMRIALQLLAADPDASFIDFLTSMIDRSQPHLLLGEMYYMRCQLALFSQPPDLERAEKDAQFLLEQFPGLNKITNTYRVLAYVSLRRSPPQYRAAADFLIQLRNQSLEPAEVNELNRFIGDCYFLNGDYANAVDFYQVAQARDGVVGGNDSQLFLRLVTAKVRSGDLESAIQYIDQADFGGSVSVTDRWRAEWNVSRALLAAGRQEVALERVRLLISDSNLDSQKDLEIRLKWLEVRLSLYSGQTDGLLERVNSIIELVKAIPTGEGEAYNVDLLISEVLLLKASILIETNNGPAGLALLEALRSDYSTTSAAIRSHIIEGDYHASIGDLSAAQSSLVRLSQDYRSSPLAPKALFEAALYAEKRGSQFFSEAIKLHFALTEQFPQSELVFSALLRQGDLLRQLNNFTGAQSVYEDLINQFPEHPLRYQAELSRADSMLALSKDNQTQLQDVSLVLERLVDLPNLPMDVQIEAGYKWGLSLIKRALSGEAVKVYTMTIEPFFKESENAEKLGPRGKYWISRLMLELGSVLESNGERSEARQVYLKVIDFNLPGREIARNRLNKLQIAETSQGT